eukprot:scaffold636_cov93-Skeletonema_menzelii.AAC.1
MRSEKGGEFTIHIKIVDFVDYETGQLLTYLHKYLKGILEYLKDEHERQFKSDMHTSEWRLVPCTEDTPQQTKYNKENGHDCGVFVCLFADFIAMDCTPIFDFDEECINKCRELISLAIMNECAIDYNLNA